MNAGGPKPSGIITLLTDFGLSDPFVGVMKGVILSRFRGACVVDLCHGIRPQAVREAAFWLERSYGSFPEGTVHVAVVDPGVGSGRDILAAAADGHFFLAPDNGLLGALVARDPQASVHALDLGRLRLDPVSATFHGRDIFAPVAAGLASAALGLAQLGPAATPRAAGFAEPRRSGSTVFGEVVTIDRFGNLITNLDASLLHGSEAPVLTIARARLRLVRTYSDVNPGELVALVNAFGRIEVAERDGNAETSLGAARGTPVTLELGANARTAAP